MYFSGDFQRFFYLKLFLFNGISDAFFPPQVHTLYLWGL
jgi:hypothetical protein